MWAVYMDFKITLCYYEVLKIINVSPEITDRFLETLLHIYNKYYLPKHQIIMKLS